MSLCALDHAGDGGLEARSCADRRPNGIVEAAFQQTSALGQSASFGVLRLFVGYAVDDDGGIGRLVGTLVAENGGISHFFKAEQSGIMKDLSMICTKSGRRLMHVRQRYRF